MITLSFGFKRPSAGDKGGGLNGFWQALEDNIQQLNDHSHNGVNSAKLTSASVTSTQQTITSAGWSASGTGFRQLVTMPAGILYDDYQILFKDSTSKEQMLLAVTRQSSNTYYVHCNDSSVGLVAYYVS